MSYSDNNSFEKIMDRCLGNKILENVDKRQGSIIYDALAPICLELAEAYVKMDIMEEQTFLTTATGINLDKRAFDYGLSRTPATNALRIAEFKKYKMDSDGNFVHDDKGNKILIDMDITEGARFTLPEDSSITFEYIGKIDKYNILKCEQTGTKGNEHVGTILPLIPIKNLIEAKITSTYEPAEDEETDEELRRRVIDSINYSSFGGNIEDYIEKVNAIDGVGNTKVFPAWQYNGSVLLSIVDPIFNPITDEFAKNLKEQIDPDEDTGQGVGIAPIGHYVTITTPAKKYVNISMSVELMNTATLETIKEDIERKISEYFETVRKSFGQNVNLTIYRARIIEKVLELKEVLNVKDVALNGNFTDVIFIDEGLIGYQYLPYMGEVTIE